MKKDKNVLYLLKGTLPLVLCKVNIVQLFVYKAWIMGFSTHGASAAFVHNAAGILHNALVMFFIQPNTLLYEICWDFFCEWLSLW